MKHILCWLIWNVLEKNLLAAIIVIFTHNKTYLQTVTLKVEKVEVVLFASLMLKSIANCVMCHALVNQKDRRLLGRYLGYQNLLMW